MAVFVLDRNKQPLMPCSEKRARLLLARGRAVVVRLHPFTLRLKDRLGGDTQALQNPEISGIEYQQGELAGYEVREYLLEKWQRACAYCGAQDVPLEIEHIVARANGGSNRVSNLTLACRACNQRTRLNRFGFPRGYLMREKRVKGFQTGDRVIAQVPSGKQAGTHIGRLAVRASGRFNIQCAHSVVQGISYHHCRVVQRADGYGYGIHPTLTEEARRDA